MAKKRCGDCKKFLPQNTNSAANDSFCLAEELMVDGLSKETDLYSEIAEKCVYFEELDRVRTNTSEFTWDPQLRSARGFDEK
ncbi:hypothetical protein HY02_05565 [Peptococcaceae bacterium SCADC1_2_3]|jgi:hypothetical protein|nr:hypothetical protein DK28_0204530 [Peptococcaceae bacterium SCADC1_2_3]KFI38233.1 hypothetical protein HY02_05565 [Peptococcaceae bacterium SCADC1_2_3]